VTTGVIKQFRLPDVGEGLTEADIIRWAVKPGDTVAVNQTIVEIETAKAAVELPSPYAGIVSALHVAEGDTVPVGTAIISIEVSDGGAPTPPPSDQVGGAAEDLIPVPEQPDNGDGREPSPDERQSVLVGYGPRAGGPVSRRRRLAPPEDTPSAHSAFTVPAGLTAPSADVPETRHRARAKPPVRKLAKTLGVDLDAVRPTGPNGTVTRADVESAGQLPRPEPGVTANGGAETRIPVRGVRKHMAAAMVSSAFTAPHVTEFLTVDVTATMELRDRVAARREFRDIKVSPLLFAAKAVILAAKRTPEMNASWDEAASEIVLKHYVNLGIAAATDRGLVVPNIKNADRMTLRELADAIAALTETARAGKTIPADMAGGTITITNVGVFGVDTGTPILNPGESGIVAFGAVRRMPWVVDEQIVPRWVTQLAVSFDHRIVDGQQGSRFLADLAAILHDPALAIL
jgi:2-oxoisovalerate dehydrogenase E2 component (dihydrolipoyl transacylase)